MPHSPSSLDRFVEAQKSDFDTALAEVRSGRKRSHWIWYIFPQLRGIGHSAFAEFYGIADAAEAKAFLAHPLLGERLCTITRALMEAEAGGAEQIFGELDAIKVRSSMTLFDAVCPNDLFAKVIDKYYGGARCRITREMLDREASRR